MKHSCGFFYILRVLCNSFFKYCITAQNEDNLLNFNYCGAHEKDKKKDNNILILIL